MSKSTDKLALLTQCVGNVSEDIKRRVKSIKLTWSSIDSGDGEYVVCPFVEIEMYPPIPAFQVQKPE